MNDRGIEFLKPKYDQNLVVAADTAYWEAQYEDGTALYEAQGGRYDAIDRSRLVSFSIVYSGENVFTTFPPPGMSGHNLVYRRRSTISVGDEAGRSVVLIVGWAPAGPIFLVDLDAGQYHEDAAGLLPTLTPMPGEPDDILLGV